MWDGSYRNFNLHRSTHQDVDKMTVLENDSEVELELDVHVFMTITDGLSIDLQHHLKNVV